VSVPRQEKGARGGNRVSPALRIGCSGWSYPHWRGRFYPEGVPESRWLEHYASEFDTVEINASFYRLPTRAAAQHWVDVTPREFTFAVKSSRYLTHIRRLREVAPGVARLRERLEPLERAGKLGPILWQLPERFPRDDDRLAAALEKLGPGEHAFEFRHPSWFDPAVAVLLRAHGVAFVHADSTQRRLPAVEPTTDWAYVRLHAGRGKRGNYSERQLRDLAAWLPDTGDRAWVYFNNDWEGFAVENARRLRELLPSS
jgi:uncharacterized protein YecE (DUF72 family)